MEYVQEKSTIMTLIKKIRSSKFRNFIWPIRSSELIKFIPMAILMFTILLNQNIVRSIKDTYIITTVGPEVIGFLKIWFELPIGIAFVVFYAFLNSRTTAENAFRIVVLIFMSFFALFGFVLFPYREFLHPSAEIVENLVSLYPNFQWFIRIWGNWSIIIIYVFGELWPVIVFTLLFWQLANKITLTDEAVRFYPFLCLFGQTNSLFSGSIVIYFSKDSHIFMPLFSHLTDQSEIMLKSLMIIVLFSGIICLIMQYFVDKNIIQDTKHYIIRKVEFKGKKIGLMESFRMILSNRYLMLMSIMLISYSMTMNLIEGVWLSEVRKVFPTASEFIAYEGRVYFWTGVFTVTCALLGSTVVRKLGWFWGAVAAPSMILFAGSIFYICVIWKDKLEYLLPLHFMISPLFFLAFVGGVQHVLSKGLKYSLFDSTKEMAYIPLDDVSKTTGKAAVDVVGAKVGKSSGAIIQTALFMIFPSANFGNIAWLLGIIFAIVCIIWIYSTKEIAKEYNSLIANNTKR